MAIQAIKGFVALPPMPIGVSSNNILNSSTIQSLDATTDRCAAIFLIPKTGIITKLAFQSGTVSGASGSVTIDVRLETVDPATGDPTGNLWATNTNGSVVIAFNEDSLWNEITLTAGASVTAGEYAAIVLNPTNFTVVSSIVIAGFGANDYNDAQAYSATNNGGAGYVKTGQVMFVGIVYNNNTYEPIKGILPLSGVTTTTFNSSSSPSRRALKFKIPFIARCCGAWLAMDYDNDFDLKLYAADGSTVLASKAMDSTMDATTTPGYYYITFNTPVTLAINTNYYLSIEPGASDISVYDWHNDLNNNVLDASPGGKNFILATYAGSWSDTDTRQPVMGLLLDGFNDNCEVFRYRKVVR